MRRDRIASAKYHSTADKSAPLSRPSGLRQEGGRTPGGRTDVWVANADSKRFRGHVSQPVSGYFQACFGNYQGCFTVRDGFAQGHGLSKNSSAGEGRMNDGRRPPLRAPLGHTANTASVRYRPNIFRRVSATVPPPRHGNTFSAVKGLRANNGAGGHADRECSTVVTAGRYCENAVPVGKRRRKADGERFFFSPVNTLRLACRHDGLCRPGEATLQLG